MRQALYQLSLTFEGEELVRPELRKFAYQEPVSSTRILRPVEFKCWFPPTQQMYGTIKGDWTEAGFDKALVGQKITALLETGETAGLLFDHETEAYFLNLNGRIFRAVYWFYVEPPARWSWRTVQWTDRVGLTALLGQVVSLWPEYPGGLRGPLLEPLRITAIYAPTALKNHGIGCAPAFTGGTGLWPLRPMHDLEEDAAIRPANLADDIRPPILLWGPEAEAKRAPTAFLREFKEATPVWTPAERENCPYLRFRIVLPDRSAPMPFEIWNEDRLKQEESLKIVQMDVAQGSSWCVECIRQGFLRVPTINQRTSLCLKHYSRYRAAEKRATTAGRAQYTAIKQPRLGFVKDPTDEAAPPQRWERPTFDLPKEEDL